MRAFEWTNRTPKFYHPEDMKQIIDYLKSNGKLNIELKLLEKMYYDYSETVCCSWRCVDDESLEQFAEYLSCCEITNGGYTYVREYEDYEDD